MQIEAQTSAQSVLKHSQMAFQLEGTHSRLQDMLGALEAIALSSGVIESLDYRNAAFRLISIAKQDLEALEAFRTLIWRDGKS